MSYYFHKKPTLGEHSVKKNEVPNAGVNCMDGFAGICLFKFEPSMWYQMKNMVQIF